MIAKFLGIPTISALRDKATKESISLPLEPDNDALIAEC